MEDRKKILFLVVHIGVYTHTHTHTYIYIHIYIHTHIYIHKYLVWGIPWTEKLGRLFCPWGPKRVGHNLATKQQQYTHTHMHTCVCVFPGGTMIKKSTCQGKSHWRLLFDPWVRRIPWRRKWQPTAVFLPGKSYGQRSLAGYSPWGLKESDQLYN